MRILQLINTFEPGGAERIMGSLALELAARGDSVIVVSLREGTFLPAPEAAFKDAGVTLVALGKVDGFHVPTLNRLAEIAREHRSEVIHAHNPLVNHYAVLAARLAGVPVVVTTVHGTSTLRMPGWARTLFSSSVLLTTRVVAVCQHVADVLQVDFPATRSKTEVICNGIEQKDLLTIKPRLPDGEFVFGTMARFAAVKDHPSMIEAFAIARRERPRCRLELLGTGELEGVLRAAAQQAAVAQAVLFRGWRTDIAGFLGGLDAFVLSSKSEGLPLALLEAMAAGLPVVSTAVGGVVDIVRSADCGWLCPPSDPCALANRMIEAMDSTDRLDKGARGRAAAIERYSLSVMTDEYQQLFRGLVKRPRTTTAGATAVSREPLKSIGYSGLRALPLGAVAALCAPVLTYHACLKQCPSDVSALDNVDPDCLYEQLSTLKKHFRFVPVDEVFAASRPKGIAAVTFDDGYKSVIDEALRVLIALDIPCTIFMGVAALEGRIFWRHKVQYIVMHGLEKECEAAMRSPRKMPGLDFYRYLKHPSNHSKRVEEDIDAFLRSRGIELEHSHHLIDSDRYFVDHPLVYYGNHTYNHYVLSSLSYQEQYEEIRRPQEYLARIPNIKISSVFSLPFGDSEHLNSDTFSVLRELRYSSLAMNRGGLSWGVRTHDGVRVLERFSPSASRIDLQLKREFVRGAGPRVR